MAVKKVICSRIQYAFLPEVNSISGGVITLKSGYSLHTLTTTSAELFQDIRYGDAGHYYTQDLDLVSEDRSQLEAMAAGELVFQLTTESGDDVIMGSLEEPARFTQGSQPLEGVKLNFHRLTVDDAF